MSTNFPASLDNSSSLPYPSAGSFTNSPSLAGLNDNQNDAVIATQTKLGIGVSTPTSGKFLTGIGSGKSEWANTVPAGTVVGTSDSQTLTNKTLTSPTITSPIITNATISTDTITGFSSSTTGNVFGVSIASGIINSNALVGSVIGTSLSTSAITLGYAQITSSFTTTSTTAVQVTGLTLTVTIPSGSRRIKITYTTKISIRTSCNIYNKWEVRKAIMF